MKPSPLSPFTQFAIVVAAAVGVLYGMSRANGAIPVSGLVGGGIVVGIVAIFLLVNRNPK